MSSSDIPEPASASTGRAETSPQWEAMAANLSDAAERAKDRIAEGTERAKRNAMGMAQQQKTTGAEKISKLARSVHGAADSFQTELPQVSRSIHDAAAALERASTALKERSIEDLAGDVGKFARAQPVAFFGAAVLAGFAVTRFIKSSAATRPLAEPEGKS